MIRRASVLFVVLLALCLPALSSEVVDAGASWWRHVQVLAGGEMEGRATGSEGHRKAAEYVAAQFERAGLKPAGASSYFQPIQFKTRRIREEQSNLALVRGSVLELVELGEDAYFGLRIDPAASLQAGAVFVGYGLTVPGKNYNDLAGMDLKGKIAVCLQGGPSSIPGPLRAHYQSPRQRWRFLQQAGAIGMAVIPNPRSMDVPWERMKLSRFRTSLSIADDRFTETPGQRIALTVNPASADKFFAGTGHTMDEILALVESDNVIGLLPGVDAKLKDEYIILTAHLDHLGVGAAIGGDAIYNGAMDNAIGVSSLIEIARALRRAPPRRSVLFAAVTGEENGLLGSQYFAALPTAPLDRIVANLNLDMCLPLHKLRLLDVYGLEESTLGEQAREVAAAFGVRVVGDPEPQRNLLIRSDQYSFLCRGIPALLFKFGYAKGSAEERAQKEWLRERYHAPSDDAKQLVDLAAATRFNQLIAALIRRVADATQRPRWKSGGFFLWYTERST